MMTTTIQPLLSYPINPELRHFQHFQFNGTTYFIYCYKSRIIVADDDCRSIQVIKTTHHQNISCLTLRPNDGAIAISSKNVVSIYRFKHDVVKWEFSLNLTLGFKIECLAFGSEKYLLVAGSTFSLWEEVKISNEDGSYSFVWMSAYSMPLPNPIHFAKFSRCEKFIASSAENNIEMIYIWYIRDNMNADQGNMSKHVYFSFLPDSNLSHENFFWIYKDNMSLLYVRHHWSSLIWKFSFSRSAIQPSIYTEVQLNDSSFPVENSEHNGDVYTLDYGNRLLSEWNLTGWDNETVPPALHDCAILTISGDDVETLKASDRSDFLSKKDDSCLFLCSGSRNVSLALINTKYFRLQLIKSWTYYSEHIRIIHGDSDTVLYLDSKKRIHYTRPKLQSSDVILSSDQVENAYVYSYNSNGSWEILCQNEGSVFILHVENRIVQKKSTIHESAAPAAFFIRGNAAIVKSEEGRATALLLDNLRTGIIDSISFNTFFSDFHLLRIYGKNAYYGVVYNKNDDEVSIGITDVHGNLTPMYSIALKDHSLSNFYYGSLLAFTVTSKSFMASRINILSSETQLYNVCRNNHGEPLCVAFFRSSLGESYFLSLHQNMLLCFLIKVDTAGFIEVSLIKSVPIPMDEISEGKCDIQATCGDVILVRNENNAYRLEIRDIVDEDTLLDHCMSPLLSPFEFIVLFLHHRDSDIAHFNGLLAESNDKSYDQVLDYAFSTASKYSHSIDESGLKALFLASLRYKMIGFEKRPEFIDELQSFEILIAYRSDSQKLIIDEHCLICEDKMNFSKFAFFGCALWIKNMDFLKSLLEKVARVEFALNSEELDIITFIYVILGKLKAASVIWKLSRQPEASKTSEFLAQNFEKPEIKLKAEKNAYALIGKQRQVLALAFFILAEKFEDAQQLSKRMDSTFRILVDRFYLLKDEFAINGFLKVKCVGQEYALHPIGLGGLFILSELQKFNKSIDIHDLRESYLLYLLKKKLVFLALFISESSEEAKLSRSVSSTVAIDNAISIMSIAHKYSKEEMMSKMRARYSLEQTFKRLKQNDLHQFELNEEINA